MQIDCKHIAINPSSLQMQHSFTLGICTDLVSVFKATASWLCCTERHHLVSSRRFPSAAVLCSCCSRVARDESSQLHSNISELSMFTFGVSLTAGTCFSCLSLDEQPATSQQSLQESFLCQWAF